MFEKASRLKLRFDTSKGLLSIEDLWDLPLTSARSANLNDIAKGINRQLKVTGEEDFVNQASSADTVLKLELDIVKHIISVRLAEAEELRLAAAKKAKKERLLEIIANKQDKQLEGASLEELQAMVATL